MPARVPELLGQFEFFDGYSKGDLETISRYLLRSTVSKGAVIFREGEPGSFMLFIVDGQVSVYKDSENGANHLLTQEGRGRTVGEMALVDRSHRSATCVAEQACDILVMTEQSLARLVSEHSAVAFQFAIGLARLLSKRLRRTSGELADFVVESYMDD
jgi:CRP/FNR family transcriptional regulator, cyclic AMP receptor protein